MPVTLNHTIVHTSDAMASATFYADILNLPPPRRLGHFTVLQVGETSRDMIETSEKISSRHFAFLVSEAEFADIMSRIAARNLPYWADPFHQSPGQTNRWDDGQGVYFDDPDGHHWELVHLSGMPQA